jgi:hypothetical protein
MIAPLGSNETGIPGRNGTEADQSTIATGPPVAERRDEWKEGGSRCC